MNEVLARNLTDIEVAHYADLGEAAAQRELARRVAAGGTTSPRLEERISELEDAIAGIEGERDEVRAEAESAQSDRDELVNLFTDLRRTMEQHDEGSGMPAATVRELLGQMQRCEEHLDIEVAA